VGATNDDPFDAIVIADGFENESDPVDALRDLAKLLGSLGVLLITAKNATHASARVKALLGDAEAPSHVVPPRRYDLAALERVAAEAGLATQERLRVAESVSAEALNAIAPGLAALITGTDASTSQFVLVTQRADRVDRSSGTTIVDALQVELNGLHAQLATATTEIALLNSDLAGARAEVAAAHTTVEDQARELDARRDALLERIELVERLHADRRHLELEIVVKDDYIAILRGDRNDWRDIHAALQNEMDELKRSRHYKVAQVLHKALTRVPFLHRLTVVGTRIAVATGRRARS